MAETQQIEQGRLLSVCTSFYALVAGHGARGDEGLARSLVETHYDVAHDRDGGSTGVGVQGGGRRLLMDWKVFFRVSLPY